jgi:SAM-dependent methyltransferase
VTAFKDHFSDRAGAYAAHRPPYPAALPDFLARVAPRRGLAWDCGCGSGQLTLALADRFERVLATDASAEQLAEAPPHPNVAYGRAPAEASGLPDGVVDLAVAAQAAHWFDLAGYYAEVRRVARRPAAVALVTYATMRIDDVIDPVIQHLYSAVLGKYWPPERRHTEDGYRTLPFPFDEIPAPALDMRAAWALADVIGYVQTWSAVRALERAEGRAPFQSWCRDLARVWGAPATVRPVQWPLSLRVGRVASTPEGTRAYAQ